MCRKFLLGCYTWCTGLCFRITLAMIGRSRKRNFEKTERTDEIAST